MENISSYKAKKTWGVGKLPTDYKNVTNWIGKDFFVSGVNISPLNSIKSMTRIYITHTDYLNKDQEQQFSDINP